MSSSPRCSPRLAAKPPTDTCAAHVSKVITMHSLANMAKIAHNAETPRHRLLATVMMLETLAKNFKEVRTPALERIVRLKCAEFTDAMNKNRDAYPDECKMMRAAIQALSEHLN